MIQTIKSKIEEEVGQMERIQIKRLLVSPEVSDVCPGIPKKVCDFLPAETGIGYSHCGITMKPDMKIKWVMT